MLAKFLWVYLGKNKLKARVYQGLSVPHIIEVVTLLDSCDTWGLPPWTMEMGGTPTGNDN
jgi:hypothetical protein